MKYYLLLLLTIPELAFWQNQSQMVNNYSPEGIITGTVTDATTNQAIEYATVSLHRMKDSTLITGTITNSQGIFRIEKVPFGMFYIHVKYLGFNSHDVKKIQISPKAPENNLGTITLEPATENLDEVTVKAKKEMLNYNLDKKVFNVDGNIAVQGGTLVDVMQNIPSVNVDIDGNVSLRGSENVTILIDNKPSQITSLDELPAAMVESVEIVTNPSARYDPDGVSGIINIVLKKKREAGYNGMVQLNAGTGDKYNGSVNLNYRKNGLNIFGNLDYRQFSMTGTSLSNRQSVINDSTSYLGQDQNFDRLGHFINLRFGIDYSFNQKTSISANYTNSNREFNSGENTWYSHLDENKTLVKRSLRNSEMLMGGNENEVSLNARHKFEEKGHELSFDGFYSQRNGRNDYELKSNNYFPDTSINAALQNTYSDGKGEVITFQTDYVKPVGNGGRLETGAKMALRTDDSDYKLENFNYATSLWENDPNFSNHFVYTTQLYSAYAIYSNIWGPLSYQGGLRYEMAYTDANQKTTSERFKKDYQSLFPSASLKYEFSEKDALQFNYSRRVNRPNPRNVNPFKNMNDPLNISYGNPKLNPEYIHSLEFSYYKRLKSTQITSTAFFRQTDSIITRIMTMDEFGVNHTTFKNLNNSQSYGFEFIVMQPLAKWWKVNLNYSIFKTILNGQGVSSQSGESNSWTAKLVSNMNLTKGLDVQIMGNYRSAVISTGSTGGRMFENVGGQGKIKEIWTIDLGMKKDILQGKGSLTFRVSDLFKTTKYDITSYGDNFETYIQRRRESRVVFVGFSYRINDYKRQKERRPEDSSGDDFE